MSRIRKACVAFVLIAVVAVVVGTVANAGGHHGRGPAAAVVHVATPTASVPPVAPSADFQADAFLNLLTNVDPAVATQLVDALSLPDRAALATDVEIRTGLAAS